MRLEGGFINNLTKVYGIYTLGFLGFVILMAILEQAGVSADAIGWMFVGFTIAIYALIGVLSRTMESGQYYVAGREVPAVFNGMATAADWMSGASFIAMAGAVSEEIRLLHSARFHWYSLRWKFSSFLRRYCPCCSLIYLCDSANHRHWYCGFSCTEYSL